MLFPAALTTDRQTLERTGRAGVAAVPVGNGAILCRVLDRYKAYVDAAHVRSWRLLLGG